MTTMKPHTSIQFCVRFFNRNFVFKVEHIQPDFSDLNPTAENIAVVIWQKLRKHIDTNKDLEVVLYETPRNFVTYKGN